MSSEGFILTRGRKEILGQTHIEYWLSSAEGPVCLLTPAQRDLFFICQSDLELAKNFLSDADIPFESRELELKTFEQRSVAALYFVSSTDAYKAKDVLDEAGLEVFEADIRLTDRFLMERFVYGSAEYVGQALPVSNYGSEYKRYQHISMRPSTYIPTLKSLSLDVECSREGVLYSIGMSSGDYKRVIMVGKKEQTAESWIHWVSNEKALLRHFIAEINQFDPDIIIGWSVVNFDFRLLIRRAELHGISLTIGRGRQKISWRDRAGEVDQGFVNISGRVIIDGIDALKTATYQFDSFSLEAVSQLLLGKGKATEDVHNRVETIEHDFRHNKQKLAYYNLQDCVLVEEIFEKTKLLDFLVLRSQLTGLDLDRVGGSVAAFLNLYLPKLHRAGYISPNRPEDGGLASPGGYVMDSIPGLYSNVIVLDFKSLYPSIIRTFKIDPLGLIEGLLESDHSIPGYKGAQFSREKHFLPDIITSLWLQRDQAKKDKDHARSQAIKILMNSFYGVLGAGGCPFYDTRLASSITLRGHDIMQQTAKWIADAGYEVIYGDTDSTFVRIVGEHSCEQIDSIGKKLANDINTRWQKKLEKEFNLTSCLELEFETHFTKFLMPTIRGSSQGSKKRYAGLKLKADGEELVFKGLETVRSDWTPLAKKFQKKLYSLVFYNKPVKEYLEQLIQDVRLGKYDGDLIYNKRLRRTLSAYVKNVPPHVRAARLADQYNKADNKPLRYQNKTWIRYVMTVNGPEPVEYLKSPVDYEHYIEKQLRPIAEAILPFVDLSFDSLIKHQMGLF
ncbi:DNA polymerase II [Teredinibacter sp. KSP-S5-2]|uniref:DNA polymerase II n=1 Tax=Teredinibacter sp. KSP-S5-2 TaxID=3034506 RepID=UPI0029347335|nr:DNA polymerase II [Teredinibacter sp. KSP-S5-2]WNO08928.1 DNA polymerase II [Teredinibacter sp. KSP-S5-2]